MLAGQRALRGYVLTYQRALSGYLLTCQRALRAYVLTCQRVLRAYVVTCLACSRAYMPTCLSCLRALVPCVLTCQRALRACVPYVLTCQNALCAYVLVCKCAILNNVNLYIIQICSLYLCLKRGNICETLANYWDLLVWIFTSTSVVFRGLGGLKMFGEKNLGKRTIYIGIALMVMPRLCCPVFHFYQF